MFADALITHPDHGEKHWTESAQALLRALILVALADPDPARRNLVTVRRLLMLTDEKIEDKLFEHPPTLGKITAQEALIEILKEQMGPHRDICLGVAGHLEGMGENERGSVLSSAKTQTQWLDDKRMQDVLSRSDFRMADLKQQAHDDLSLPSGDAHGNACALAAPHDPARAFGHGANEGEAPCPGAVRAR